MSTEVKNVSNPLTLVLNIKSEADAIKVQEFLANETTKKTINEALENIRTVHFARFVFLSKLQLAVITSYDGDFDVYIQRFADDLGEIFNVLLKLMTGTDGLFPVWENLADLKKYIKKNDRSHINGVLQSEFCAYPTLTVQDILKKSKQA
jgi:hypothetical protein